MVAAQSTKRAFLSLSTHKSNAYVQLKCLAQLLLAAVLCLFFLQPQRALANDAIIERAYFEDPSNALQINDVRGDAFAEQFKPYTGPLNRGYSKSALWLKLTLRPIDTSNSDATPQVAHPDQRYVLRIQPSYLDEIALFEAESATKGSRLTGDQYPMSSQAYRSLNHNFVIQASSQPQTVWLRLKTSSTSLIHVEASSMEQAIAKDALQYLLMGSFIGFLFLFFCWAAVHWLDHREPMIGVLAVNQFIALAFSLAILGYNRFIWGNQIPAEWLDTSTSVLSLLAAASSIYFNMQFLKEFDPPPIGQRLILGMVAMLPVELLLLSSGQVLAAMQLNMLMVTLAPICFMLIALNCRAWTLPQPTPPVFSKTMLVSFYGLSLVLLIGFALPSLGLIPSTEMALQTNSIYGLVTGLILIVTLQLRSRRQQKSHLEAQKNLEVAQQQVVQETKQREDQVQFMAMLTHELKTPLSIVRMALGADASSQKIKARADQAIQDMSNVIDRCAWIDRLHEREFVITKSGFDLVEELDRIIFSNNAQGRIQQVSSIASCSVASDVRMVGTLMGNLIDNALKYAHPDSPIDVRVVPKLQEQPPHVAVEITSRPGLCGWPEASKVFEKYYRSPGARRQTGSGLGLYQAAHIAQQLGGKMHYVPDEHYVRFQLCLPC
jgi:signal transduction histidine kinase